MSNEVDSDLPARVASLVREVQDYPKPGVIFKDITPVLADGPTLRSVVDWMATPFAGAIDVIVAIEARGFVLGAAVAYSLGVGLVPIRKVGKLPGATVGVAYELEYGEATLEMHSDALCPASRALIVDDVIATGGTLVATIDLVRGAGALPAAICALLSIDALGGRRRLSDHDVRVLVE